MRTKPPPPHIVIAGGGVAAVEAMLALRALAGPGPAITLLTPDTELSPPAISVASPFGFGLPTALPLAPLAEGHHVHLRRGLLGEVDMARRVAVPVEDDPMPYDHLLLAVGARRRAAVRGALTFRGPGEVAPVEAMLDDIVAGRGTRLVVAVPTTGTWPLPAYELAIMAAVELRSRGVSAPRVAVVTPETMPLGVFGTEAGDAVAELLRARDIELYTASTPHAVSDGALVTAEGAIAADHVIALPESVGPYLPGLPHDAKGFIPTDLHGRVDGCDAVYAAGDATTFPLRQGGLAAQQADAAAETIAARLGAIATPRPFRPVLRGVLLTGGAPLYLRAEVDADTDPVTRRLPIGHRGSAGPRSLWWPPAKVAGRYLAPLLSTARPPALLSSPMSDLADTATAEADTGTEEALALVLAIADEDASHGDYRQALHALDAARGLTGGLLPEAYADKERDWLARV
jgi:sulfide:quinone oxidoreductase